MERSQMKPNFLIQSTSNGYSSLCAPPFYEYMWLAIVVSNGLLIELCGAFSKVVLRFSVL
jgi:hypothetical protein